jgi:tetratricopeptide (TPR) repeat protein
MRFLRSLVAGFVLLDTALAQDVDPFLAPKEMAQYMRLNSAVYQGTKAQLQAILTAIFKPVEQGGLGMQYDNERTRTVAEVWNERRANCLSLTAFFVAASRSIGQEVGYSEALNTNRWRRVGGLIRFERHVVALAQIPPLEDLVADFLPQMRRRVGTYVVSPLPLNSFKALYFSNRAVELMESGDMDAALAMAERSVGTDPGLSTGWNIRGVVLKTRGDQVGAEASFRRAARLDPSDFAAVGNLESMMRAQGRFDEALAFRARSLQLRKRDPYFQAFLAEEALNDGNSDEAEKRIKAAIKLHSMESEFYLFQARLYLLKGRLDDAGKCIETAKKWANPVEQERYDNKLIALKRQQEEQGRKK